MHSDMNVNLRAARGLVTTAHATRDEQQSALASLDRDITRQGHSIRRARHAKRFIPGVFAVATMTTIAAILWTLDRNGQLTVTGTWQALIALGCVGAPCIAGFLTAEVLELRHTAAESHLEHLLTKRDSLQHLLTRMNLTVAESEHVLAQHERGTAS
ncbi:hypothetical protein [Curtobacterium sp. MCSS17_016]|uniref:hypothetical protein n=1 Tax=Curtobacterium sp. MCSS17_016 TaxID=2175644 RepID=UPI000DB0AC51|nr:hypothetical protein [Curtobacterium sp. MCSS17_016]WIE81356.1 hypothetical protein DEJ19_019165 [Curtobacterium sp. MCSS17_016]